MNKLIYYLFLAIGLIPSLLFNNISSEHTEVSAKAQQIEIQFQNQNTENLYFSDMAEAQDSNIVAWHGSHRSHGSHGSHGSHASHRSGF